MVKIFGIPMSSLGGVHLISGIAHFDTKAIFISYSYQKL